jgi:hypothetical protein
MSTALFDIYNRQEHPSLTLCQPDKTEIYSLNSAINVTIKQKWNAIWELSFDFNYMIDGTILDAYFYIESKRLVKVEGIGYFVIVNPTEENDGIRYTKHVTCESLESELKYKKIMAFTGTYLFYSSASPTNTDTFMGAVLAGNTDWTAGTVDSTIATMYRTFNESDTNIYQLLTTTAEVNYGCVFIFDTFNKTIDVINATQSPGATDIFLSFDNLLKRTQYDEISEEIATCAYCYGDGSLTIRNVNPLGTNAIYNFTYYKTLAWMDQGLIDAITAWENLVTANYATYSSYVTQLSTDQVRYDEAVTILADYQSTLDADISACAVRVQGGLDTTEITAKILEDTFILSYQTALVAQLNDVLVLDQANLSAINTLLAFTNTNNFSAVQYAKLKSFIYENTYKNDSITITDSMTAVEEQAQSQQLYDMGVASLVKASVPRYQITIEAINFLAIKEYAHFIEQLELGDQITVDTGKGFFIDATLLEYDYNMDDPTDFSIILSNRQRLDNASFIMGDYLTDQNRASTAIKYQSSDWHDWTQNKSTIIGYGVTPAGVITYGTLASSLTGTVNANRTLVIKNTNSTSGSTNFYLDQNGVILRDASLYSGSQIGTSACIVTTGGNILFFSNGIFIGGTGLSEGSSPLITLENLTGSIGTAFSTARTFLAGTLWVWVNGLFQPPGVTFQENGTHALTMLDPILIDDDSFIIGYIALN